MSVIAAKALEISWRPSSSLYRRRRPNRRGSAVFTTNRARRHRKQAGRRRVTTPSDRLDVRPPWGGGPARGEDYFLVAGLTPGLSLKNCLLRSVKFFH